MTFKRKLGKRILLDFEDRLETLDIYEAHSKQIIIRDSLSPRFILAHLDNKPHPRRYHLMKILDDRITLVADLSMFQ